jgi:hypothetical protein
VSQNEPVRPGADLAGQFVMGSHQRGYDARVPGQQRALTVRPVVPRFAGAGECCPQPIGVFEREVPAPRRHNRPRAVQPGQQAHDGWQVAGRELAASLAVGQIRADCQRVPGRQSADDLARR